MGRFIERQDVTVLLVVLLLSGLLMRQAKCQVGLTNEGKQQILDELNRLRGLVNPTAANMRRLVWNDELAEIAQNHSERCVFQHNYNLDSQSDSFDMIGETIAAVAGIGTARSLVLYWFNQTDAYSYESNTCSGVCSTYRQIAWANTSDLGCGVFGCLYLHGLGFDTTFFVCNYGESERVSTEHPYISGTPCSQCPEGFSSCINNLCSPPLPPTTAAPPTTTQESDSTTLDPSTTAPPSTSQQISTTQAPSTTAPMELLSTAPPTTPLVSTTAPWTSTSPPTTSQISSTTAPQDSTTLSHTTSTTAAEDSTAGPTSSSTTSSWSSTGASTTSQISNTLSQSSPPVRGQAVNSSARHTGQQYCIKIFWMIFAIINFLEF